MTILKDTYKSSFNKLSTRLTFVLSDFNVLNKSLTKMQL